MVHAMRHCFKYVFVPVSIEVYYTNSRDIADISQKTVSMGIFNIEKWYLQVRLTQTWYRPSKYKKKSVTQKKKRHTKFSIVH